MDIVIKWENVWRDGFCLYKNALSDPQQLLKDVRVQFEGQEGIDAGALKFELLMHEIDVTLLDFLRKVSNCTINFN
jgi:hypothetical protein